MDSYNYKVIRWNCLCAEKDILCLFSLAECRSLFQYKTAAGLLYDNKDFKQIVKCHGTVCTSGYVLLFIILYYYALSVMIYLNE